MLLVLLVLLWLVLRWLVLVLLVLVLLVLLVRVLLVPDRVVLGAAPLVPVRHTGGGHGGQSAMRRRRQAPMSGWIPVSWHRS